MAQSLERKVGTPVKLSMWVDYGGGDGPAWYEETLFGHVLAGPLTWVQNEMDVRGLILATGYKPSMHYAVFQEETVNEIPACPVMVENFHCDVCHSEI